MTTSTPVPAYTYINPDGVYFFQLRVPKDIAALPASQRHGLPSSLIRKSLKTHSRVEAAKRVGGLLAHYLTLFDQVRTDSGLVVPPRGYQEPVVLKQLTLSEAESIALKYREATERKALEVARPFMALTPNQADEWKVTVDPGMARELTIRGSQESQPCQDLERFYQQNAIEIDHPSKQLVTALSVRTLNTMLQEDAVTATIELARAREAQLPTSKQMPLLSLVNELVARKKPRPDRERAYRAVAASYEEYLKRKAIVPDDFERSRLLEYRNDVLRTNKISSWNAYTASIMNMLINLAFELELISRPFSIRLSADEEKATRRALKLPIHDQSDEERRAFTDQELKAIKSFRVYRQHSEYLDFLLFTGMRCTEAAQLMPSDVIETKGHGLFVRVRDTEGRSVKTAASVRTVPVPNGSLTDYIKSNMDKQYLFPRIAPDDCPPEKRANLIIDKFSRQKQRAGFDKQVTLYSFRHAWKHRARAARVEDYLSDYITGHSNKNNQVAMDYGQGFDTVYNRLREASDAVLQKIIEADQAIN
ncbi:DUF6538 domain-containing protein [Chromobacterium rhizoryzae]|uniref:DUF6538 domain-containing protein n=1 Tax=Chromobacterium rhizoryzae TaxID=1778675 RepID=UPI001D07ED20|nr:DUF6538 domain-containing protein [Chromobacterium rhizoryzae]